MEAANAESMTGSLKLSNSNCSSPRPSQRLSLIQQELKEASSGISRGAHIASSVPFSPQNLQSIGQNRGYQCSQPSYTLSNGLPAHLIALPPLSVSIDLTRDRPLTPQEGSGKSPANPNFDKRERVGYRLWREGKAVLGGRVMTGAGQDFGDNAIDKKIEATLPRAEQHVNARSRKASHHMGIFKENEPDQDRSQAVKRGHRSGVIPDPRKDHSRTFKDAEAGGTLDPFSLHFCRFLTQP